MGITLKNLLATLTLVALLAPGLSQAGPDLEPYQYPDWEAPILVTDGGIQSTTFGPLPGHVFGGDSTFFGFALTNSGDTPGGVNHSVWLRRNDGNLLGFGSGSVNGLIYYGLNQQATVPGGRHTIWLDIDANDDIVEDDETNNQTAVQYAWTPETFPTSDPTLMNRPPMPYAGQEYLPGGSSWVANVDAFAISPGSGNGFVAGAASPLLDGNDFDVFLHSHGTGAEDGLTTADRLAYSTIGGAYVDGVMVNDNPNSPGEQFDLAVKNYSSTDAGYIFQIRRSTITRLTGFIRNSFLEQDQILHVEEWDVSDLAAKTVVLDIPAGSPPVYLGLYDPAVPFSGLRGGLGVAAPNENGRAAITFTPSQTGRYGVALFRNAFESTAPVDYSLRLIEAPADLAIDTLAGSHGPLVPYSGAFPGNFGDPLPAPASLPGDESNTNLYQHFSNQGPGAADNYNINYSLDGNPLSSWPFAFTGPDPAQVHTFATGPYPISGGIHTVAVHLDGDDQLFELNEENNDFAEQWVWDPVSMPEDGTVQRTTLPVRNGSHEFIPEGVTRHDNQDGLRSPVFVNDGENGYWGALSILAADSADPDLRLFTPSMGAQDGFRDPVSSSTRGSSRTDFILVDFNQTDHGQAWDAGIMRFSGDSPVSVQATRSRWLGSFQVGLPPLSQVGQLDPGQSLAVFEFLVEELVVGEPVRINMENLAGGAELELGLFASQAEIAFQNISSHVAFEYSNGPGTDLTLTFTPESAGYHAITVSKMGHESHDLGAEFRLTIGLDSLSNTPDNQLPTFTGLDSVFPNPFNPRTTVKLAMQQPGEAQVRVYDVSGRLVRTLHEGHLEAGHHEMNWSGRNDAGRNVPSGLYFVRANHPGGSSSMRMSLIK